MAPLTLEVRTKRVYEPPDPRDGLRVLVDRVWPRGLTKERVRADMWLKDAAPSAALRRWFGHDRAKWDGFRRRYFEELDSRQETLQRLRVEAAGGPITLLFSARDTEHNQAVALREYLLARRPRARSARGARAARPPPGRTNDRPFRRPIRSGNFRAVSTVQPKVVEKPWGREIWYAHAERYAGKVLEVTRGHLLSLQKHRVKHETLYLQSGRMRFTLEDEVFEWTPGESVVIPPGTVHRMEALEDSVILEVSTPELDDVVRLEDRYGRT